MSTPESRQPGKVLRFPEERVASDHIPVETDFYAGVANREDSAFAMPSLDDPLADLFTDIAERRAAKLPPALHLAPQLGEKAARLYRANSDKN